MNAAVACVHCNKEPHAGFFQCGENVLCVACFRQRDIRQQYKTKPTRRESPVALKPGDKACQHCKARKVNRPRGLCWRCYYTPGVRELYGPTSKHGERGLSCKRLKKAKTPTRFPPGSDEKIAVMAERLRRGEKIFHPKDKKDWS